MAHPNAKRFGWIPQQTIHEYVGNNINSEPSNKNINIGIAYNDHERQEIELKKSNLDYTIVRPTGLTNFEKEKKIIESFNNKPKPNLTISRKNVAKFMVNALKKDILIRKTVVISE